MHGLYDRMMRLAASPYALWGLIAVAFIESSFFPIPPDVLLIPMALADRRRAWFYAGVATLSSVAGGFLGYAIGYFAFATIGRPVLDFYGAMPRYEALKASFDQWGVWIIIAKGMTPIPYKLVTIASGALLWWFGEPIRHFIEKRMALVTTVFLIFLVGGFVALRFL